MVAPRDIADYFLSKADEDAGDLISKLKLQKLLYYAQGFHLALYDTPLFDEGVFAWQHGPVVPSIFHAFKGFEKDALPRPVKTPDLDKKTVELLDEVYKVYGQFSAWKLRDMTHAELPWRQTPIGEEISRDLMREYFSTQLV
jgi:uncharacterized phage-associated protein